MLEWLKLGVIQPARSRYNSPIFAVMKKDGGVRLVQDFRALNNQSYTDKYSMKDVSECIGEIGRSGSTIFSTIDLTAGFWQMILHPRARPYTAFTVPGMGQLFVNDVGFYHFVPMKSKGDAGDALLEFIQEVGIPGALHTDDAKELTSGKWEKVRKDHGIKQTLAEPYSPFQNRTEVNIRELKKHVRHLMG